MAGPAADSQQNPRRDRVWAGLQGGRGRGAAPGAGRGPELRPQPRPVPPPTYLFRSQMISGLGLPSALQVKNTVFPEVTSASWGSDVIRGLSVPTRNGGLLGLGCTGDKDPHRPSTSRANQSPRCVWATHVPTRGAGRPPLGETTSQGESSRRVSSSRRVPRGRRTPHGAHAPRIAVSSGKGAESHTCPARAAPRAAGQAGQQRGQQSRTSAAGYLWMEMRPFATVPADADWTRVQPADAQRVCVRAWELAADTDA